MQDSFFDWVSTKETGNMLIPDILNEVGAYCEKAKFFEINLYDSVDPVILCFAESIIESEEFESQYHHRELAAGILNLYKEFLFSLPSYKDTPWWKKEVVNCIESGLSLLIYKKNWDWAGTEPKKFFYKGRALTVPSWKSLYINICSSLYKDFPEVFSRCIGKSFLSGNSPDIVDKKEIKSLRKLGKLGESLYVELDLSTKEIVERIYALFELCHISPVNLPILCDMGQIGVPVNSPSQSDMADEKVIAKEDTGGEQTEIAVGKESASVGAIDAQEAEIKKVLPLKQKNDLPTNNDTYGEKAKNNVEELRLFDLEGEESPSFVQPVMFSLSDSPHLGVKDWRDLYLRVVRQIYKIHPEIKGNLKRNNFAESSKAGFTGGKLDDDLFLFMDITDKEILKRIREILVACNI